MMKKLMVCFLLLSVSLCFFACKVQEATPVSKEPITWTPIYNDHECGVQASRSLPEGVTERKLTENEIKTVVPEALLSKTEGTAYFFPDGSVYYLCMHIQLGEEYASVCLGRGFDWGGCCLSITNDGAAEKTSLCGNVEYSLFRQERPGSDMLLGTGRLNGIPILVRIDTNMISQQTAEFENILELFARYEGDTLSFSDIKP